MLFAERRERRGLSESLVGLSVVAVVEKEWLSAARFIAISEAMRETIGSDADSSYCAEYDECKHAIRDALGDGPFTAEMNAGKTYTIKEAVALTVG